MGSNATKLSSSSKGNNDTLSSYSSCSYDNSGEKATNKKMFSFFFNNNKRKRKPAIVNPPPPPPLLSRTESTISGADMIRKELFCPRNVQVFTLLLGKRHKSKSKLNMIPVELFQELFEMLDDETILIKLKDERHRDGVSSTSNYLSNKKIMQFRLFRHSLEEEIVHVLRKYIFRDNKGHMFRCTINIEGNYFNPLTKLQDPVNGMTFVVLDCGFRQAAAQVLYLVSQRPFLSNSMSARHDYIHDDGLLF